MILAAIILCSLVTFSARGAETDPKEVIVGSGELQDAISDSEITAEEKSAPIIFKLTGDQTAIISDGNSAFNLSGFSDVKIQSHDITKRTLSLASDAENPVSGTILQWHETNKTVESPKNLSLSYLLFAGGGAENGVTAITSGAGLSLKNLTKVELKSVVFEKNRVAINSATESARGGGVFLDSITESNFTSTVFGAAPQSNSSGKITDIEITAAKSRGNIVENDAGNAIGGGAFITQGEKYNFSQTKFYYNQAKTKSGDAFGGGAAIDNATSINFTSAVFSGNESQTKTGNAFGGGIALLNSTGVFDDTDTENKTDKRIFFTSSGFYGNFATAESFTETDGKITGAAFGGGAYLKNCEWVSFDKSYFSGNETRTLVPDEVEETGEDKPLEAVKKDSGKYAFGGAMAIVDSENIAVTNVAFVLNKATATGNNALLASGGAIYVTGSAKLDFTGSGFQANWALSDKNAQGGAVAIESKTGGNYEFNKTQFYQNWAQTTFNTGTAYGGAIFLDGGSKANFTASDFQANTAKAETRKIENVAANSFAGGGAIYARAQEESLTLDFTDSRFISNVATGTNAAGGAVLLDANGKSMTLKLGASEDKSSLWYYNKANTQDNSIAFTNTGSDETNYTVDVNVGKKGALFILDGMTADTNSKVTFNIKNDGTFSSSKDERGVFWLGGTNKFEKGADFNFDKGLFVIGIKYSDLGAPTANDVNTKLDLGSGTIYVGKTDVTEKATLAVFTTKTQADAPIQNGKIIFRDNGNLSIHFRDSDYKELKLGDSQKRYFAGTNVEISGLAEGEVDFNFDLAKAYTSNPLFITTYNIEDNSITLFRRGAATAMKNLPRELANLLDLYSGGNAIITMAFIEHGASADITIASALNPTGSVSPSQQSISATSAIVDASRAAPHASSSGNSLAAKNDAKNNFKNDSTVRGQFRKKQKDQGVWVMPIYTHDQASNLRVGEYSFGYTANQYGAVFGMDRQLGNVRLGFAGAAGGGTSQSNGDLVATSGSTGFGGIHIYADTTTWGGIDIFGTIGWLGASSTIEQNMFGATNSANVTSGSFFMVFAAERPLRVSRLLVTPMLELRYNLVYQQEFKTIWADYTTAVTEGTSAHTLTTPLGVRLSADFEFLDGTLTPSIQTRLIPNVGERELKYNVNAVGSTIPAMMRSVIVDRIGGEFGGGTRWYRRGYEGGIDYTFTFSEHFKTHNVALLMKWKF